MEKIAVGTRVGAILSMDEDEVCLLGYGVFEGDQPLPAGYQLMGFNMEGTPNPRIRLDDGRLIYGCECWWGPEQEIRDSIVGKKVTSADIDHERKEAGINLPS